MAQSHKFQDLEETGDVLVSFINSSQPERLIQVKEGHQALFDKHLEEAAGQRLMDMEEEKNQREEELQILEDQLRKFLQRELESLRIEDHELDVLRSEEFHDISSIKYVAQVYYLITKIKWEYDTPPNVLKGVHYGPDLATPINMDTSSLSPCEVSDQLWSFVSTEW
ncbi:hypothetical protein F7725_003935 [Dissostichus mawsoni]|uniref:Kinetochore protein Spc24 n=1 Tax=Dissostichus mawsoni TaxID=36200 RepID=A0A7J5YE83_DISMA|nr:hypothetical protein F7725_003935 [Dissostichus mawsoni]